MAVICNKTNLTVIFFLNFVQQLCYFFYNEFIETGLRLNNVTSELMKIDHRNRYMLLIIISLEQLHTSIILYLCII